MSPLLTGQRINRRSLQLRAAGGHSNCFVLPFLIENFLYPAEHHFEEKKMFFKRKKIVLWASGRPLHGCRHSLHVGLLTMKSFRISPSATPVGGSIRRLLLFRAPVDAFLVSSFQSNDKIGK
jgi:hypothetical protein